MLQGKVQRLGWLKTLTWIPEEMTFLGVAVITFAAIQLIHESKLLITVVLDDAELEPLGSRRPTALWKTINYAVNQLEAARSDTSTKVIP